MRPPMASVEIPYSVAAALPSLVVLDITNDVRRAVEAADVDAGIVYVTAATGVVRVNEREAGLFDDIEAMLGRLVPDDSSDDRARTLAFLLGPRTEQVPFSDGRLCLGTWQRVLLVAFGDDVEPDWTLTIVG